MAASKEGSADHLDGELAAEAEWYLDALARNDRESAELDRRAAQQDRVLRRLEDALEQPAPQRRRAGSAFTAPTTEGSLAAAAERQTFQKYAEAGDGISSLLAQFAEAALDGDGDPALWDEVEEVLANGRVEMLHTEPWSGMPDELIEVHFAELRDTLYSQVALLATPEQAEKENRFNQKVAQLRESAPPLPAAMADAAIVSALGSELAQAPDARDPREKLQVLEHVLEMIGLLVRATDESDADAVVAATVGTILHAKPIPELFRTVAFLRAYLERNARDRMGSGGFAVATFEAALLQLLDTEPPAPKSEARPVRAVP